MTVPGRNRGWIWFFVILGFLATVRQAANEIATSRALSRKALDIIVRAFALPSSAPLQAVLDFVSKWEEKATTQTKQVGELVE